MSPRIKLKGRRCGPREDAREFSSPDGALAALKKIGGDAVFIEWLLERSSVVPHRFHWSKRSVRSISGSAKRLREALACSPDFTTLCRASMETLGNILPFPLWDLMEEVRERTGARGGGLPNNFGEWLRQLELTAEVFSSEAGRKLFYAPKRRGGHTPQSDQIFGWLGSLVPYTASLNPKNKPDWKWIESWVAHLTGGDISAKKLWDETVVARVAVGRLDPNIERGLKHSALQFLVYRRSHLPTIKDRRSRPWTTEEMRYLRAVKSHTSFLGRTFYASPNYGELLRRNDPLPAQDLERLWVAVTK